MMPKPLPNKVKSLHSSSRSRAKVENLQYQNSNQLMKDSNDDELFPMFDDQSENNVNVSLLKDSIEVKDSVLHKEEHIVSDNQVDEDASSIDFSLAEFKQIPSNKEKEEEQMKESSQYVSESQLSGVQIETGIQTPLNCDINRASLLKISSCLRKTKTPQSKDSVKRKIRWSDNWSRKKHSGVETPTLSQEHSGHDYETSSLSCASPVVASKKLSTVLSEECIEIEEEECDNEPIEKTEGCTRLEKQFYALTAEYFKTAFTILVKRKGLYPDEAFKSGKRFGVDVPVFLDPEGYPSNVPSEYAAKFSGKFVDFIQQNVVEAAIFHVIIKDKHDRPRTVQRYVFQIVGYFMANECSDDSHSINQILNEAKAEYGTSILELMTDADIKNVEIPWMSKWNLSLGIKKEYIAMTKMAGLDHMGPFFDDDNLHYFPWTKRPRISQAKKLGVDMKFPPPNKRPANFFSNYLKEKAAEEAKLTTPQEEVPNGAVSSAILNESKLETWQYFTSSDESDNENDNENPDASFSSTSHKREKKKTEKQPNTMYPISSFMPAKGLLINIYRVDYPHKITEELLQHAIKSEKWFFGNAIIPE